jgi:hypothetical protein
MKGTKIERMRCELNELYIETMNTILKKYGEVENEGEREIGYCCEVVRLCDECEWYRSCGRAMKKEKFSGWKSICVKG